jgi:spore coat polysaccharide biosynthesis predicted glycosyltransferase SpsG
MAPGVICGAKVKISDSSPANLHTVYAQPAQLELPAGIELLRESCGLVIAPGGSDIYELVFVGTEALTPGVPVTFQSHTVFGLTAPTCP